MSVPVSLSLHPSPFSPVKIKGSTEERERDTVSFSRERISPGVSSASRRLPVFFRIKTLKTSDPAGFRVLSELLVWRLPAASGRKYVKWQFVLRLETGIYGGVIGVGGVHVVILIARRGCQTPGAACRDVKVQTGA